MGLTSPNDGGSGAERKTRGNATLVGLAPELEEELFKHTQGHTLQETQELLLTDPRFRIEVSRQTISTWAAKKRKEADDFRFRVWLGNLAENSVRAREVVRQVTGGDLPGGTDNIEHIEQGNSAVLNALLMQALQSGDPQTIALYAKLSAMVGETRAKQRSATAALLSAETASKRFYFDAAKLALEHAAELQAINQSTGSQREKIERAVTRLFGARPETSKVEANADNNGSATETRTLDIGRATLDKVQDITPKTLDKEAGR